MSPFQGPCADSQLGLWKLTNGSQVEENNLLAYGKGLLQGDPGSYTSISSTLTNYLAFSFLGYFTKKTFKLWPTF